MRRNLISMMLAGSMMWANAGVAFAQSGGAGTSGGAASGGAASSAPAAAAAPAPVQAGPAAGPAAPGAATISPLIYVGAAILVGGIVCAVACGGGTSGTSTTATH